MSEQICLVPYLQGLGGMVSFQAKLIQGLNEYHIDHTFDLSDPRNDAILVIGGTRQLAALLKAKRRGVRIVQRLNGMNWLHKVEKTNLKPWLRCEATNRLLAIIRRSICDRIIYQSEFSHSWWEDEHGHLQKPFRVIFNGVDLNVYSPEGEETAPNDHFRILLVEGHLSGQYARGLEVALQLVTTLQNRTEKSIELMVAGDVSESTRTLYRNKYPDIFLTWAGVIPRNDIPALDRNAHLLYSADLNAACPNSVIEALACGLPVLAYDTGALAEIVKDNAGAVVPYGSDHWSLQNPNIGNLADAAIQILEENHRYRIAARNRAETAFDLNVMVKGYLEELLG
ncbi:MAG: glycosyltransferase family 4 protein [Anaerolineaceae bacterium]|nr:glycosyltransferase family 4 protein [Anaerolineaceae bacterium]